MRLFIHCFVTFSLCLAGYAGFAQEPGFPIPPHNPNQLFYMQRTPNTNTIIYELNYKNGNLDPEDPIHPYWIRYTENGQKQELNYIQKKFAYGLKMKKLSENNYEFSFVSYKKLKFYLMKGGDQKWHVFSKVNQKYVIINYIYIKINKGGTFWSPNVEYFELNGVEPGSNIAQKERLSV